MNVKPTTKQPSHLIKPAPGPSRVCWIALALCLCAGPALACPMADSLAQGIEITYDTGTDDPFVLTYQRRSDGAIVEREEYGDGEYGYIVSSDGILESTYFTAGLDAVAPKGETSQYSYDFTIAFPLEPYATYTGTQTERFGEEPPVTLPAKVSILQTAPLQIGECAYTATQVQTYYYRDDGFLLIEQAYLAELSAAILMGYFESGYDAEDYIPSAIRALP